MTARYLQKVVPIQYKKLDIKLSALIPYLTVHHGSDPNKCPDHPNISAFVKEKQQTEVAPNVVRQLS